MKTPSADILQHMRDSLDYDARSGDLTWVIPPLAGELAGHVHKYDGSLVVGIRYKQYRAAHVAIFLHTGEWPTGRVNFNDKNPSNIAWTNLSLRKLSNDPKAAYARTLRHRRRIEAEQIRREYEGVSDVAGVRFSVGDIGAEDPAPRKPGEKPLTDAQLGKWLACDPDDRDRIRGSFKTQHEAEVFQRLFQLALGYIADHPRPYLDEQASSIRAGSLDGLTLAEAHKILCYDGDHGAFYYRLGHLRGHRADHLNTKNRPVVTFSSRQYPAAMLAWFMTKHEWPARKSIIYRDRNPQNFAFSNLLLPPVIDRSHRVTPMQEATE